MLSCCLLPHFNRSEYHIQNCNVIDKPRKSYLAVKEGKHHEKNKNTVSHNGQDSRIFSHGIIHRADCISTNQGYYKDAQDTEIPVVCPERSIRIMATYLGKGYH